MPDISKLFLIEILSSGMLEEKSKADNLVFFMGIKAVYSRTS